MSIWYYICLHAFHQSYTVFSLLQGQRSLERPLWREGAERAFSCPFMFVTCQRGPRAMSHLWFFSKGAVSVQTTPADCPRCALLFSSKTSSENVILQCWPVQSVSLSLLAGVSSGNMMNKLGVWGFWVFLVVVFVWLCGLVWFWFVCLLVGWGWGGQTVRSWRGLFVSFPSALRKINLWMLAFSWSFASHWYVLLLDQCIPLPRQFPASPAELHPWILSVSSPPDCTEYRTFLQR